MHQPGTVFLATAQTCARPLCNLWLRGGFLNGSLREETPHGGGDFL